jgi:hypothetical protein
VLNKETHMNEGRSVSSLAAELERQVATRKDFIAPVAKLEAVVANDGLVSLAGLNGDAYPLNPWAGSQIAQYTDIPKAYFDRILRDEPDLAARSINTLMHRHKGDKRLVRTLDGKVRAFVSDRYRPLDNIDLAAAILPVLVSSGAMIRSSEVTETRLYIKFSYPEVTAMVRGSKRVGDIIEAGGVVSNSEVGNGALWVADFEFMLACLNGMMRESLLRKAHLGRGQKVEIEDAREFFSTGTQKLDDAALWSKVADVVRATANRDRFQKYIDGLSAATENKIESLDLTAVVEVVTERLALPESVSRRILRNLAEGGDLSQYGLSNAITATANDEMDYEVATVLERAGSKLIDLTASEWRKVSTAESKAA